MGFFTVVVLVSFSAFSVTVPYVSSEKKLQLPRDVIDSFKVTSFGEISGPVSEHRSLNTVSGVIPDYDLKFLSEDELLEGLKEQNDTNVYRIKIKRENTEMETKHIVLTFSSSILPESVDVLEKHTYGLAIYDQDLDGDLDCLVVKRTELDKNARTTTFLFEFGRPGSPQRQALKWNFKAGETPDQLVTTIDDDEDHPFISRFSYTDYATCAVFEAPLNGRQECILFTTKEVKDNISQNCMDQFQDICELSVLVFDENCYEDDE